MRRAITVQVSPRRFSPSRADANKLQPISATYNNLLTLTGDTKIIAAAEIGSVMEPSLLKAYQADWAWFVVWSGDYISAGVWNSLDLLKRVYNDAYVLTLDEIQGWRKK